MSIDWTQTLVVAGTDRVATVEQKRGPFGEYAVKADWVNTGNRYTIHFLEHGISRGNSYRVENAVTNEMLLCLCADLSAGGETQIVERSVKFNDGFTCKITVEVVAD